MNKKTGLISLLLALSFIIFMGLNNVYAEGTPVIEMSSDKVSVSPKDTVTITFTLKNVQAFGAMNMKVKTTGLALKEGKIGKDVASATGAAVAKFNGDTFFISGINPEEAKNIKDLVLGTATYKVDQNAKEVKVELTEIYCESAGQEITQNIEYPKEGITLTDDTHLEIKETDEKHIDNDADGECDVCGADLTEIGKRENDRLDGEVTGIGRQYGYIAIIIVVLCVAGILLLRRKDSKKS